MTDQAFGAQLLTLPQIFEDHFFTIPDYQRGYAWDEKQVKDLLKDIDHLLDDGMTHRHYTGTLVFSRPKGVAANEYHLVDGQQRLTTLVILLSVLSNVLPQEEQDTFKSKYLRRGEIGSDRAVLQLNSDTRHFFERVAMGDGSIQNYEITLEAQERLLKARKVIQNWLNDRIEAGTPIDQLRVTIESELGFLVYAPIEDAETGIMFEVINNRGKPLSELEKVKNYLIYCCVKLNATSLRSSIDRDWSTILSHLNLAKKTSPSDEGAFLRYCMVVHFKLNKADSQYGYDELKKRLAIDSALKDDVRKAKIIQEIDAFVRFMLAAALWYARLYGRRHGNLDARLVAILDQLRGQDRHASIMPLFLALTIKHEGRGAQLIRLLSLLEKVNFRVYMARNITARNDSGQGYLYGYASSYYHGSLLIELPEQQRKLGKQTVANNEDALEYRLVAFAHWYAPDNLFEKSFQLEAGSGDDFYDWGGLRYFLMCYAQFLQPNKTVLIDKITLSRSEGKSADYLSVEHLWAREYRNGDGENNRPRDSFERRRLGNFVLLELRLNIQGSNDGIDNKIRRYLNGFENEPATGLEQVRKAAKAANAVLKEMDGWTRSKNYFLELYHTINDHQEKRYIDFALNRWSVKDFAGYRELSKAAAEGWDER